MDDAIEEPADRTAKQSALAPRVKCQLPEPELILALTYVIVCVSICLIFGIIINAPSLHSLDFTGMSNIVPTAVVIFAFITILLTQNSASLRYLATTLASYVAILVVHFNLKLGVHLVNPANWDAAFWGIDQTLRPLVDSAFAVHLALANLLGSTINRLYLFAFLAMFASSIIIHAIHSFEDLRKVVLASMLVHMLGGLSYLIAPALGPFIYEAGVNPLETRRETYMLETYHQLVAGGVQWFAANGPDHLATGLAAMPSLHAASSGVFIFFAWRYERYLLWFYVPLFLFILIEAIATRWHYLVDIPAGLALTVIAVAAVEYGFARSQGSRPKSIAKQSGCQDLRPVK